MSIEAACRPVDVRSGEALPLAMQSLFLTGRILPFGAVLGVRHTFVCEGRKPVEAVYAFALPRDAALRRFRVTAGSTTVESDLRPAEEAAEIYEQGIEDGSLSALTQVYRDGVVNLNVGNIRPGETVTVVLELVAGLDCRDDGFRFRFPFTMAPCYTPTAVTETTPDGAGRTLLPEDLFGDVMLPEWRPSAEGLHGVGFTLDLCVLNEIREIASPSHHIRMRREGVGRATVELAPESDVPNRDLVLDVVWEKPQVRVFGGPTSAGDQHYAVLAPSSALSENLPENAGKTAGPKRFVFLLDRSGSMAGTPIEQARKAVLACLAAFDARDEFSIVAFDDRVEHFEPKLVRTTAAARRRAAKFLDRIDARGGTELAQGIQAAADLFGDRSGDIVVVTDGQVFAGEDILATAEQASLRLHCLGIGSASQDRFLALLARRTGGVSRFATPRERVDVAALELFSSIRSPAAVGISIHAKVAETRVRPVPPDTVYAGNPLLIFVEALEDVRNPHVTIEYHAPDGSAAARLEVPLRSESADLADTVRLLQGARIITDLASKWSSQEDLRAQRRLRRMLENAGREFGLSNRTMSLVAVMKRVGDRPGVLPKTIAVPVGMPEDTPFGAYFSPPPSGIVYSAPPDLAEAEPVCYAYCRPAVAPRRTRRPRRGSARGRFRLSREERPEPRTESDEPVGRIIEYIIGLEPDGGMPGDCIEERILHTCLAALAVVEAGYTLTGGPFSGHLRKMLGFL